jgi:hypothetical protein
MSSKKDPKPNIGGLFPHINIEGADKALEFYQRAFAATEVSPNLPRMANA